MKYLTLAHVQTLHDMAIDEHGGLHGTRSEELLESAVSMPQQSAFGEDAYPTIAAKAAAYAYFIISNHPFLDGNKRTGTNAMLTFLYLSGHRLHVTEDHLVDTIVKVAAKEITKNEFFVWVAGAISLSR